MFNKHNSDLPINLEEFIKKIESEENLNNLVSDLINEYFARLHKGKVLENGE